MSLFGPNWLRCLVSLPRNSSNSCHKRVLCHFLLEGIRDINGIQFVTICFHDLCVEMGYQQMDANTFHVPTSSYSMGAVGPIVHIAPHSTSDLGPIRFAPVHLSRASATVSCVVF